ncbi:Hypothetical predicted protein [Podarcis lilfordi]|uniref:Uncharacterized protein n=1 Tax=Podarcis lilfordi TaxID=74358 RepID=A0AA35KMD7_9SAUR|nr:Hypothetical predicted protein [Podarcis lilfordi]
MTSRRVRAAAGLELGKLRAAMLTRGARELGGGRESKRKSWQHQALLLIALRTLPATAMVVRQPPPQNVFLSQLSCVAA